MNNILDSGRFLQLFNKHTRENFRFYLMSLLVLTGLLVIFFSYIAYETEGRLSYDRELQFRIYLIFFLLSGAIFSSTVFSHFGNKRSRTMSLILPSSNFEKFLVGWIYVFVLFPILYTLVFYLLDFAMAFCVPRKGRDSFKIWNVFVADEQHYMVFLLFYLLTSVGFWGAIMFKNLHFIKTAASFFAAGSLLVMANTAFIKCLIIKPLGASMPFGGLSFFLKDNYYNLIIDSSLTYVIGTISVIVPVLWLSAYFKLKEKEV